MEEKFKFGLYALIVIIFQSILKITGVLLTHSLSFLSETMDTITDIFFVSLTLVALKKSDKPPDFEHMYGHSKIDSIGALIQGIVLTNLYVLLIYNSIFTFLSGKYFVENAELGLEFLIVSFLVNIIFSRYLIWQGKKRKSLSLQIQGMNLFQDSMRAIIVMISFIFILFGIFAMDIFFSIIISGIIIAQSIKLIKKGIDELIDINPIDSKILLELKKDIFSIDHVNGVKEVKARASGSKLYLDIKINVEDHISIIHANRIMHIIKDLTENYFPEYEIEHLIEMYPIMSESSLGESLINLISSLKMDYSEILEIKDISLLSFQEKIILSMILVLNEELTLKQAHIICTRFENELKEQVPQITRIISHIEAKSKIPFENYGEIKCNEISQEDLNSIKNIIESCLKQNNFVKGYHGLECWESIEYWIIELHVFLDDDLNISLVHSIITELEELIKINLKEKKIKDVLIHTEPITGRSDGIFF